MKLTLYSWIFDERLLCYLSSRYLGAFYSSSQTVTWALARDIMVFTSGRYGHDRVLVTGGVLVQFGCYQLLRSCEWGGALV